MGQNYIFEKKIIFKLFLFLFLFLFLLSPYIVFNGIHLHGGLFVFIILLFLTPISLLNILKSKFFIYLVSILVFFVCYANIIASFYGFSDFIFTKLLCSTFVYVVVGFILATNFYKNYFNLREAFYIIFFISLFVIFINSIIIISEYFFPFIKTIIESFLEDATNIDYKAHTFRFRGVASGGGAALSVFHSYGLLIAINLYQQHRLSFISLWITSIVIFLSILLIGRTGFIIIVIGYSFLLISCLLSKSLKNIKKSILLIFSFFLVIIFLIKFINEFFSMDVLEYSLLFFFDGFDGIRSEGTFDKIVTFYSFPDRIDQILLGVGYYIGSFEFSAEIDSGYMKTFTALGLPLTILFYFFILLFIKKLYKIIPYRSFFILTIIVIFFAELKEPFLIKGYLARFFWLIIGMAIFYFRVENSFYNRNNKHSINNSKKQVVLNS